MMVAEILAPAALGRQAVHRPPSQGFEARQGEAARARASPLRKPRLRPAPEKGGLGAKVSQNHHDGATNWRAPRQPKIRPLPRSEAAKEEAPHRMGTGCGARSTRLSFAVMLSRRAQPNVRVCSARSLLALGAILDTGATNRDPGGDQAAGDDEHHPGHERMMADRERHDDLEKNANPSETSPWKISLRSASSRINSQLIRRRRSACVRPRTNPGTRIR